MSELQTSAASSHYSSVLKINEIMEFMELKDDEASLLTEVWKEVNHNISYQTFPSPPK